MNEGMRGKFIVFEGLDGSGKGTQIHRAAAHIFGRRKEYDVLVTREPTRRTKELRERMAASRDVTEHARWYAQVFVEDRRLHIREQIEPALLFGSHVLCDRYMYSTLAYQACQGIPMQELLDLHTGLPAPDLVIILDVTPEVALSRRAAGGATDVFDVAATDWLAQLRARYLELPSLLPKHNIQIVDASLSPDDVAASINSHLNAIL